jgi:hypothetical protein
VLQVRGGEGRGLATRQEEVLCCAMCAHGLQVTHIRPPGHSHTASRSLTHKRQEILLRVHFMGRSRGWLAAHKVVVVMSAHSLYLTNTPPGGMYLCGVLSFVTTNTGSAHCTTLLKPSLQRTHRLSAAALSRSRRLSISICFSPAPLTCPPPATRSKWVHMRVSRGSWYSV